MLNVIDYGSAVVVAAFYKKLYGKFPSMGLSGAQAEFADIIVDHLPEKLDAGEIIKRVPKTVEQAILDKILFIGEEIPLRLANDKRPKFVVLGCPQELIDETAPVNPGRE